MKHTPFLYLLFGATATQAQNLVPNPGFESVSGYVTGTSLFSCADNWRNNAWPGNAAMNTPDLGFTGSTFFSTLSAYEGIHYASMDCSVNNPEFIQVKLNAPLAAGTTYCISFYTSYYNKVWNTPPSSLGAYFTTTQLTVNPHTMGIAPHVEYPGPADPTQWVQVSATYTAAGGEEYLTLGCFQGNPAVFSYIYIDMVDVHPMNIAVDLGNDMQLCEGESTGLDAGNDGTAYLWSTGETTAAIMANEPGTYWVQKFSGACPVTDTIVLFTTGCPVVIPKPVPVDPVTLGEGIVFVPNSFSPNGDGFNDVFAAKGERVADVEMIVYNRWGQAVFTTNALDKSWDGTVNGHEAPQDVYVYSLRYHNGVRLVSTSGHVTLLR